MTPPEKKLAWYDPLHPAWLVVFLVLVLLWLGAAQWPSWPPPWLRIPARLCGYAGALAMLVPYFHILRRRRRYRAFRAQAWLGCHIFFAYLSFLCVLVHSGGRASSLVTLALLCLFWIVMVSGVVGYYGQKLLYRLMPLVIEREVGRERLELECVRLRKEGMFQLITLLSLPAGMTRKQWNTAWKRLEELKVSPNLALIEQKVDALPLHPDDVAREKVLECLNELVSLDEPSFQRMVGGLRHGLSATEQQLLERDRQLPRASFLSWFWRVISGSVPSQQQGYIEDQCEQVFGKTLLQPPTFWKWLVGGRGIEPIPPNHFRRARELADEPRRAIIDEMENLVEQRRQLELEYRMHALGRGWLLFHGPAAVLLLALMIDHIWTSIKYGGL